MERLSDSLRRLSSANSSMGEVRSFGDLFRDVLAHPGKYEPQTPEDKEAQVLRRIEHFNAQPGKLIDYDCPNCANKGLIMTGINDYGQEILERCQCMVVRANYARIRQSGLSSLMVNMTFARFETDTPNRKSVKTNALEYVVQYGSGSSLCPEKWFFVGGRVGSGKTHICSAILNELMTRGVHALFMSWRESVVAIKSIVTDPVSYSAIMNPLRTVPVLYIDDFLKAGCDGNTSADVNVAIDLINARYTDPRLVTIISGEHRMAGINKLDEAVGTRIQQRCANFCFNLAPERFENYRLKNG